MTNSGDLVLTIDRTPLAVHAVRNNASYATFSSSYLYYYFHNVAIFSPPPARAHVAGESHLRLPTATHRTIPPCYYCAKWSSCSNILLDSAELTASWTHHSSAHNPFLKAGSTAEADAARAARAPVHASRRVFLCISYILIGEMSSAASSLDEWPLVFYNWILFSLYIAL